MTTTTTETQPKAIYINKKGLIYFSTTDEDGQTIYSFTEDFEDTWTQEVEDEYEIS
jgi:hypothetical protein